MNLTLNKLSLSINRCLRCVNIIILLVLIWGSLSSSSFSHEEQPSVADFEVIDLTLSMKIITNLETLLNGSSDDLRAVILAELDRADEGSYSDLGIDAIKELLLRGWPFLRAEFFFRANQERLQLHLENLLIELNGDEKSVAIFVTAKIPADSEYLTFGWSQKFGDLVIRELGEREGLYSGYLSKGETSPKIPLKVGELSSRGSQFFSYMLSGVYHIVPIGFDHILFIIGLYLVSNHLRSLIFQVSLFTFAHTITLGLASFEIISVSAAIVEPIIAASIIYIGLENYFVREQNSSRGVVIFGFGLLHGLGFAGVLTSLELTNAGILFPLLAFNLGVEFGQFLVLFLCFISFGYWYRNKAWYHLRVVRPISIVLILTGSFWLIERIV